MSQPGNPTAINKGGLTEGGLLWPPLVKRKRNMSTKKQTGGPVGEMTLRDYFAASAMTGMMANTLGTNGAHSQVAEIAYRQADAMLEARK